MTIREAQAREMTMGERIARLNEIPMERLRDMRSIWGDAASFTCGQCGKDVEIKLTQRIEDWRYTVQTSRHGHRSTVTRFCSWSCMQAWRRGHEKTTPNLATNGRRYTPEEEDLIVRMHREGKKWPEIAAACGRNENAVRCHYNNNLSYVGREMEA